MSSTTVAGRAQAGGSLQQAWNAAVSTARGRLPQRYLEPWSADFDACVRPLLVPGVRILDAGAGRKPTIPPGERPPGCVYVGIDISAEELERAGPDAYDDAAVSDVTKLVPGYVDGFDLVLSWQVLEHVKPLDDAIANFRSYLRPGGTLVAEMSGTFSAFGMANRVLPHRLGRWLAPKLAGREEGSVFPAHYHHCYAGAFEDMAWDWTSWQTIPRYLGAFYFGFARPLQAAYVGYEEWARVAGHRNLATHYVIHAVK
jgi:SAM-dependent methyltransferase